MSKLDPAFEAKLRSSGLTAKDAELLKISFVPAAAVPKLHPAFKPLKALRLDYHGPDGRPLPDWPGAKPFYRLRYLETPSGFDGLAAKQPRYVQAPNTAPVAYYPRNQDWSHVVADADKPLILTEGEFKAAKACKEGFPTIGLGGVYNWRAMKLGVTFLPTLELVNWVKRNVYICFDSDLKSNEAVSQALHQLAEALHRQGAFAHLVSLPVIKGVDKVGLDDFLVHAGASAREQFADLLASAEPLGLTQPLWQLNERYVYVRNPGLVLEQSSQLAKVNPSAFRDHVAAPAEYQERTIKGDGKVSFKAVSAAAAWLKWPLRNEVERLTYRPAAPRFIKGTVSTLYNTWSGWGVEPKRGCGVKPFLDLVKHLFSGAEEEAMTWFLRWCAYPLQYPGTKLFTSAVLHGIRHGTGKSFVGYSLGRIYGKNFTEINQMDLHNHFNEWAEGKQFVMGDDVTGQNKRSDADFLKKLITQRELRVNGKYVPTYVVPDCVNYLFTANHPDSFFLEDDDRRFFIHEVTVGPLPEEFYTEYELWLDTGGAEALFDHLLRLDLGDFNPSAPAFKTLAKERMTSNVQSDLASWVRTLKSSPGQLLRVGEVEVTKDLFTSKELLDFYDPTGRTGTTANGVGRELARAGVRQVLSGRPVRTADGFQARYYAVRNADRWLKASVDDLAKHVEGWTHQLGQTKAPKY